MPSNSVVLNVQGTCGSGGGSGSGGASGAISFNLMLDSVLNNNISSFMPYQTAYLKLYKGGLNPTLKSNLGTLSFKRQDIFEVVTEQIIFIRSNKGTLTAEPVNAGKLPTVPPIVGQTSYTPAGSIISTTNSNAGLVNYQWQGNAPNVNILFTDKTITLNPKNPNESPNITGILNVAYYTSYDSLTLYSTSAGTIICEAYIDTITPNLTPTINNQVGTITPQIYGSLAVSFGGDLANTSRPVSITVKDACSQALIVGANVYVDGQFVGITSTGGTVACGSLQVGTHTLKITALNYTDSDKDTILNDMFVVPPVTA
ncbi:MAG: hypothetical protein HQK93_03400 [Nitrospirae bacterium]|nr:hypothetical protein [Nitrospirota bacterium]